ncbi:MAG TPA: 30S ribosomal protein S12 methylthiotransferase RimO, partial [Opitutaceae bacterium]|nr:30S ribosomal protein S12 methylthiotransferase RimO [Opitutaceae bacterium]
RRRGQKLIVAGCMSQRFAKDLPGEIPEVDAFIGLDQITKVAPIIAEIYAKERGHGAVPASFVTPRSTYIPDYDTPRFRLTPRHFAYVKIAEGCNHPCTFCIIPQIRGRHRSRTVESVVAEARRLVTEGVKELNLISQDTTFFGMDRWEERPNPRTPVDSSRGDALTTLLRELNAIEGDFWIRLLYTHPAHWSDELIATIAACPKIARYVDMPLQHISERMLEAMQRETSGAYIRDLIKRIRAGIPGIAVRTTFITGFPGETEADVDELCAFIEETKFERLGVFRFSREEGTRATKLDGQIPAKEKERRWHRLMTLQKDIAAQVSANYAGRTLKVLVEEPGVARGEADAPDIDGRVYVPRELPVGEFAEVKITGHHDYDLLALPPGQKPAEFKAAKQAQ